MTILSATALLYLACFAFYHAHKRRTHFPWIKSAPIRGRVVRYGGWLIALSGMGLLARQFGWELGIPLWLAVFVFAGISSLLISALWPKKHLASAIFSFVILLLGGVYLVVGGIA